MDNAIKNLRASTGLSQAKFAEAYHIPKRTIEEWECGRRKPPDYVLELLTFKVQYDLKNSWKRCWHIQICSAYAGVILDCKNRVEQGWIRGEGKNIIGGGEKVTCQTMNCECAMWHARISRRKHVMKSGCVWPSALIRPPSSRRISRTMSTRNGYAKDVRIITTGIKQNESIMCESALGRKWPGAFVLRMRGGDWRKRSLKTVQTICPAYAGGWSYAQHAGMVLRTDDGSWGSH